jgi:hypothetical protein
MSIGISTLKVIDVIELGHELEAAEDEFDAYIEALNEDEQAALVALMWVGRGSFEAEDWEDALNTALTEATTPTADYLKGTPHFADHLESGLDTLGLNEDDDEDEDDDPLDMGDGDEDY